MTSWGSAKLVEVDHGALATEMHGLGVMLIINGDEYNLSWTLRVGGKGVTLPDVEEIAEEVSAAMHAALSQYDVEWKPDD